MKKKLQNQNKFEPLPYAHRVLDTVTVRYLILATAVLAIPIGGCSTLPSASEIPSLSAEIRTTQGDSDASIEDRSDGSEQQDEELDGIADESDEFKPDRPVDHDANGLIEEQPGSLFEEQSDDQNESQPDDHNENQSDDHNENQPDDSIADEAETIENQPAEDRPEEEQDNDAQNESSEPDFTVVKNILPLGDSITEGVPFTYRHSLYSKLTRANYAFDFVGSHRNGADGYPDNGWDRDNEGWSGWTTESIQQELFNWSSAYTVDVALIHLGTNDAGGNDVEASAAAMTAIVEQLRVNNGSVAICIAQILPFGPIPQEPGEPGTTELNTFVDNWNSRLRTIASNMTTPESPILLVDMNSDFGEADLDDGVHPTRQGAERMADKWLECILSL